VKVGAINSLWRPFSNWKLKPSGDGEPAHGYFRRLVFNEGQDSANVYANEIGLNGRNWQPSETLDALLTLPLAEQYKETLRRFTPVADGKYFDVAGQRLRQRQFSFSTRRFCRACLNVSAHHRIWWDIVAFTTCPIHGTPVESTDESGEPIGWWWADMSSDTSGRPLATSAPSVADARSQSLEAFVVERFGHTHASTWRLLAPYFVYEVIEACEYLGAWLGNGRSETPPPRKARNLRHRHGGAGGHARRSCGHDESLVRRASA
jgi:hypothetical protein